MTDMAAIKQVFFEECGEQLTELETGLLEMEEGNSDPERINAIFRAVHSIKGGAGAFDLEVLVHFSHVFENTLDLIRANQLDPTNEVVKLMLKATDVLFDLVAAAREERDVAKASWEPLATELAQHNETVTGGSDAETDSDDPFGAMDDGGDFDFEPITISIGDPDEAEADSEVADSEAIDSTYTVKFRPLPELYASANEPLRILRELSHLGEANIECDASDTPLLDEFDPAGAYLSWTITLVTDADEAAVRELFEFVEGACVLEINEAVSQTPLASDVVEMDLEPIQDELTQGEPTPDALPEISEAEDKAPVTETAPAPQPVAAEKEKTKAKAAGGSSSTIRVDTDRIDRLINLVGELVITQSMLSQRAQDSDVSNSEQVAVGLDELEQLTREIQDSVMAIRAQPVKMLFQRMSRVTREVAAATGKSVNLVFEGEATEVDKTVIERLADPLTHMIRNAADHGLESPEGRIAAGKPEEGTIKLSASHRSGRVVIEVTDDGAGINREKVQQIAVDKGLISADANLSEKEIDNLIFMAGFSTVDNISAISGRGVGMDVVKSSIQGLGGRIAISSNPGKGSVFSMSLPLTLAVLEGMIVTIKSHTFVVPLTSIVETLRPEGNGLHPIGKDASVVVVRDQFVPVIDLGLDLGLDQVSSDPLSNTAIIVETETGAQNALLVDEIQDQRQVVIKSLDKNYGHVEGIAAATVLGDGRIALILDVEAIVERAKCSPLLNETVVKKAG